MMYITFTVLAAVLIIACIRGYKRRALRHISYKPKYDIGDQLFLELEDNSELMRDPFKAPEVEVIDLKRNQCGVCFYQFQSLLEESRGKKYSASCESTDKRSYKVC